VNDSTPPTALRRLAHELRNAIAPVRNAAHLLRKRGAGDPMIAAALKTIDSAVDRSLRLLDRAVDAERVMRGDIPIASEDVELRSVVQRAIQDTASAVGEKNQQVRVALPADAPYVRGDADRLVQVLSALIDNASRYSSEGSDIEVVVEARDGDVQVLVRDHGEGMSAELAARVLDPLTRPDDGDGSFASSLPVAKRLIELHRGRLEAKSDGERHGSEFVVTLPRTDAMARGAPTSSPSTQPAANAARRVLLVDDNRAVRETYADVLAELGCDVDTAADGEQAIARAIEARPRFVILDINLPKRNGYEVARALRARFTPREMTLVMISGTGLDASTVAMARAAGFDHCLDKASDLSALEQLLAS
jgi:CheY-like chemotaxis protein/anti-sigma regulatory factor (Ser/Thr protein kinase)